MRSVVSCFKNIAIGCVLLSANLANAGHSIGNGGNVIVCGHGADKTYKALDVYDAEKIGVVDFGDRSLSVQRKVQSKISDIRSFDKKWGDHLQGWADTFFSESEFQRDEKITYMYDIGGVIYPEECHLEPVIIQISNPAPRTPRYLIAKTRWSLLDRDNQAALILHEIIYREALSRGQKDSLSTRNFLRLLFTGRISTKVLTAMEFRELLKNSFLGEFQLRIRNADSWTYLRYFDDLFLTQQEASQYCDSLPHGGRLLTLEELKKFILSSENAIRKRLLSTPLDKIWLQPKDAIFQVNSLSITLEREGSRLSFICYTNYTFSPH